MRLGQDLEWEFGARIRGLLLLLLNRLLNIVLSYEGPVSGRG